MTRSPAYYSSDQVSNLLLGQLRSKQGLNDLMLTRLARTRRGDAIVRRDFQLADQMEAEEVRIGTPCPYFMHSFSEGNNARPVMFHLQVNSDASTIIEIGNRFAQIWSLTAA